MPNYGLVVNPQYNPMSYDDYAKPFEQYAKVYEQMADKYDALETTASDMEKLALNAADAEQYAQYLQYANDLRAAASDLSDNGLSTKTRGRVSNLLQRYNKEIKPISNAWDKREELAKEQRALQAQHNGALQFTVDFSKIGVGEIMRNPAIGYNQRNLDLMEKDAQEQAAALSARTISEPTKVMANQYYQILQGKGQAEADAFLERMLNNNPDSANEIDRLFSALQQQYGTTSNESPYSTKQNTEADIRLRNGILKGLALNVNYQTNHWALPGASSKGQGSGGSNNNEVSYEDIGYEDVVYDAEGNEIGRYTVVNEGGVETYYTVYNPDTNPNPKKLSPQEVEANGLNNRARVRRKARYQLETHNSNGNQSYVVDLLTGMKVTQNNGELLVLDRTKDERFNSITRSIIKEGKKQGNGKASIRAGQVGVFEVNSEDASIMTSTIVPAGNKKNTNAKHGGGEVYNIDGAEYVNKTLPDDVQEYCEKYLANIGISDLENYNITIGKKDGKKRKLIKLVPKNNVSYIPPAQPTRTTAPTPPTVSQDTTSVQQQKQEVMVGY